MGAKRRSSRNDGAVAAENARVGREWVQVPALSCGISAIPVLIHLLNHCCSHTVRISEETFYSTHLQVKGVM